MSFYENTSKKILFHDLKCQYDYEYIASSQCSWFCYSMLNKLRQNNWIIEYNIKSLYEDALEEASNKRKNFGTAPWGESIFSKIILDEYNFQISEPYVSYYGKIENPLQNNTMKEYIDYKNNLKIKPFSELCFEISRIFGEKKFMLINRFGQSFLVFPDIENFTLKIFDSHQRCIGDFTSEGVIKYILIEGNSSQIIWLTGGMNDYKINKLIYDKLYYHKI